MGLVAPVTDQRLFFSLGASHRDRSRTIRIDKKKISSGTQGGNPNCYVIVNIY